MNPSETVQIIQALSAAIVAILAVVPTALAVWHIALKKGKETPRREDVAYALSAGTTTQVPVV